MGWQACTRISPFSAAKSPGKRKKIRPPAGAGGRRWFTAVGLQVAEVEDQGQDRLEDRGVVAVAVVATVLRLAVVAILVTAAEALAEVVVVLPAIDVIAAVAVVGVLVGERVAVVRTPAVHAVGTTGLVALLVTQSHGLAQQ